MCVPASASTLPAAFETTPSSPRGEHALARRLRFVREYSVWRRAVHELWRFKWREHRAKAMPDDAQPVIGAYHTRGHAIAYFIRHGTRDVGIFSEVFIAGEYDPPPAVASRLAQLGRPPRILDLGANIGLFAAACRERWPGTHVVSVEPDPENLEILRRTAADTDEIEVIAACAGDRDGSVRFVAGQFAESHVADDDTAAEDTIEVPCVDALRLATAADLVKIDIEGSEWEILADPRFASIDAQVLVMEWHEERCPHPDPPAAAHAALRDAGFQVLGEHRPVPSNGTIWALRST
jgi:FkbM family methyltransferase